MSRRYLDGNDFYGSKYTGWRSSAEVAKDYRADVKAAIKAGELPPGLKLSVKSNSYTGGQSIDVTVREVGDDFPVGTRDAPSDEFRALLKRLDGAFDGLFHVRVRIHQLDAIALASEIPHPCGVLVGVLSRAVDRFVWMTADEKRAVRSAKLALKKGAYADQVRDAWVAWQAAGFDTRWDETGKALKAAYAMVEA
jgi:hypothetical protein